MKYSEKLPKIVTRTEERCQHLHDSGDRCDENAAVECYQFENKEDNDYGGWHITYFCKEHAKLRNIKIKS